jgi:hypothetical protein
VGVTSGIVVCLSILSIYLVASFLRFKSRVLIFFTEIDPEIVHFNEQCARDYYDFLVSDSKALLAESKQSLEEHTQLREEINRQLNLLEHNRELKVNNEVDRAVGF